MKPLVPFLFAAAFVFSALTAHAGIVFEDSFEAPTVTARTPKAAGADISKAPVAKPGDKPAWRSFEDQPNIGAGGSVTAGLTQEVAHTGTQALFVEAAKLSAPYIGALFTSRPIAIEGGKTYKAGLWGRNDAKKPLVCGAAQLFLKMQIDFFTDEGQTETGESQYLLQPLPGGRGHDPIFVPNAWKSVGLGFTAPSNAKYLVVSFRCDSSAERGAITGAIYFDDFTLESVAAVPVDPMLEKIRKQLEAEALTDSDDEPKVNEKPAAKGNSKP